jgi:hypothetical protein
MVREGAELCMRMPWLVGGLYVVFAFAVTTNLVLRVALARTEQRAGRSKSGTERVITVLSMWIYMLNAAAAYRSLGHDEFITDRTTMFLFASSATCISVEHMLSGWRAVSLRWRRYEGRAASEGGPMIRAN